MVIVKHFVKKHQFYNNSIHQLIEREIPTILPKLENQHRYKRSVIVPIISGIFGLAHETLSYFLKCKRDNALKKAYEKLQSNQNLVKNQWNQCNKDMLMYGQYNLDTIEHIIDTTNDLHNGTVKVENLFEENDNFWPFHYSDPAGMIHFAMNGLLYYCI